MAKEIQNAEYIFSVKLFHAIASEKFDSVEKMVSELDWFCFDNQKFASMFKACQELMATGNRFSLADIQNRLLSVDDKYRLTDGEFIQLMREGFELIVSEYGHEADALNIVNNWKSREVDKAYRTDTKGDIDSKIRILNEVTEKLLKGMDVVSDSGSSLKAIIQEEMPKRFTKKDKHRLYFGFSPIDGVVDGLEDEDLMILAARPGVGKSALALNLAVSSARKNGTVCFFSMEMGKSQIYDRVASAFIQIDMKRIRNAEEYKDSGERQDWEIGNMELAKTPLVVWDEPGLSVADIEKRVRKVKGCRLIIIDYLQLMKPSKFSTNESSEIGSISKDLKKLAMKIHVPILVLSQLNRAIESRSDKKPTLADLRGSGDLEQDANIITFLYNTDEDDKGSDPDNPEKIKAIDTQKNRQGTIGVKKAIFKCDIQKMCAYEVYDNNDSDGFAPINSKKSSIRDMGFSQESLELFPTTNGMHPFL